jgi:hypothetical protein
MAAGASVVSRAGDPDLMCTRPHAVSAWLTEHGEAVSGTVAIRRVGMGQSNITSIVTDAEGREWVLREPPPGTRTVDRSRRFRSNF